MPSVQNYPYTLSNSTVWWLWCFGSHNYITVRISNLGRLCSAVVVLSSHRNGIYECKWRTPAMVLEIRLSMNLKLGNLFKHINPSCSQILGADYAVLLTASLQLKVFFDLKQRPDVASRILTDFTLFPRNLLANLKVCISCGYEWYPFYLQV